MRINEVKDKIKPITVIWLALKFEKIKLFAKRLKIGSKSDFKNLSNIYSELSGRVKICPGKIKSGFDIWSLFALYISIYLQGLPYIL